MTSLLRKSQLQMALAVVIFKLVLDISYWLAVSPVYAYSGFTVEPGAGRIVESYLLAIVLGLLLPPNMQRVSQFLVWMLGVSALVPMLSYYSLHSGSRQYLYAAALSFLLVRICITAPPLKVKALRRASRAFIWVMVIADFFVALSMLGRGGLSHFNLDFSQVYVHRREVEALIGTGMFAYLNTWAFKVINPALIAWALWRRRNLALVILLGLQVVYFGVSSHKSVLFSPLLIAAVYFVGTRGVSHTVLTWCLSLAVAVSSFWTVQLGWIWPLSLFVRRLFFVPAQLNFAYYELFSSIGHVNLSNGMLGAWLRYPFSYPPQALVSSYVWGHYNTWANTGFLGTSYMHLGYVGMFLFSGVVGGLFLAVDSLVRNGVPAWLGLSVVVVPFHSLILSSDLSTALLTHGLLLALAVLYALSSEGNLPDTAQRRDRLTGVTVRRAPKEMCSLRT